MPTQKKVEVVEELKDLFSRSTVVIGADYRGLKVSEVNALRRLLQGAGIEMHVVKNTLLRRAAEAIGKPELSELAEGPTALIVGFDDPLVPVKTVVEYQRTARNTFVARKAYVEGDIVSGPRLPELATLPGKEVLLGQIVGALESPIATFAYLIQASLQEFLGLVEARADQLGDAA